MAAPMVFRRFGARSYVFNFLRRRPRIFVFYRLQHESSMKVNHAVVLDKYVEAAVEGGLNPKKHPGILNIRPVQLPHSLVSAMQVLLERYPTKDLERAKEKFVNYLWSRHPPQDDALIQKKAATLEKELLAKENVDISTMTVEQYRTFEAKIKGKLMKRLRYMTYHWQPVQYDAYQSFLYMVSRLHLDYSAVYKILNEIKLRDPDFSPINMFDFGSGVGSSIWAVNSVWPKQMQEHYCVDISNDMNTIARLLLQGAEEFAEPCFPSVYFRQSVPAVNNRYDLVISAFSLFELPSQSERLKLLLNLWRKTDGYLIIVEQGTNAAFQLINEAKEFIIQLSAQSVNTSTEDQLEGHVFAPCPHELPCPRLSLHDNSPCNFQVHCYDWQREKQQKKVHSRYSYIVLKKGRQRERDAAGHQWPRLVRSSTKSNKCVHCRMCTAQGQLQYSIITGKKHGKSLYRSAKASDWSDLLPVYNAQVEEDIISQ